MCSERKIAFDGVGDFDLGEKHGLDVEFQE
jgi:hypothetical protein